MIPVGWKDDGTTLSAPSGHSCRDGFRAEVLKGWEASDQPLEQEHGDDLVAGGTMQRFTRTVLRWNTRDGVTVHPLDNTATHTTEKQQALAALATLQSVLPVLS